MNLKCVSSQAVATKAQVLVLFSAQDEKKIYCDSSEFPEATKLINEAFEEGRFKGSAKETVFFRSSKADGFQHLLLVGLGKKKDVNEECLRIASAVTVKALAKEKVLSAVVSLKAFRKLTKTADGAGKAVAEGFLLGNYKYDEFKSKKKDDSSKELSEVFFALTDKGALKKFEAGVQFGIITSNATNFARDLGNSPGNAMTPTELAKRAQEGAKGTSVKVTVLDKKQIEKLKMGCFLGVNKGSHEPPKFIIMEYWGGKKSQNPLVLVGKGLTFDTGGISIKPSAAMEEMKFDMCGGAAVIAAMSAIGKLKLKVNVVGLVPSTENMPGGLAVKPGDILTAMNGKTVEVNNTDAEGRLILSDALVYACTHYKPAAILDTATLTGACVVALGNVFGGLFSKDEKLLKKIHAALSQTGERFWELPLVEDYVEDMKGAYADLQNITAGGRGGGASHGAAFLSQFVDEGLPWAHFDIAGIAYHNGARKAYNPDKGASGAAVRAFVETAKLFA